VLKKVLATCRSEERDGVLLPMYKSILPCLLRRMNIIDFPHDPLGPLNLSHDHGIVPCDDFVRSRVLLSALSMENVATSSSLRSCPSPSIRN